MQCNPPCCIVHNLIAFCQPWLDLHRIGIMKQRLTDPIADTPSRNSRCAWLTSDSSFSALKCVAVYGAFHLYHLPLCLTTETVPPPECRTKHMQFFFLLPFFLCILYSPVFANGTTIPLGLISVSTVFCRLYSINSFVFLFPGTPIPPCLPAPRFFLPHDNHTAAELPAQGRGRSTASQVLLPAAVFSAVERSAPCTAARGAHSLPRRRSEETAAQQEPAQLRAL